MTRLEPRPSRAVERAATPRRADPTPRATALRCAPALRPARTGMVGGAPRASSTRTLPGSILRMRHEVLPSWKMLPAMLSMAKSSLTRADADLARLEQDVVVGGVGDRAAVGDRGEPRAAPRAQLAVDAVVVQVGAAPPGAAGEPVAQHRRSLRRTSRASRSRYGQARRTRSKSSSSLQSSAATAATICWARMSSGQLGNLEMVELAARDRAHQRDRLDQLVAREREEPALGSRAHGVARAADALQQRRDRARRAELADQVDARRCRCRARARRSRPARAARRP